MTLWISHYSRILVTSNQSKYLYRIKIVLKHSIWSLGAEAVIQSAETSMPVLALAVRGPHAHSVLKDLTNSLDSVLVMKTDPPSKILNHCRGQGSPLLYSPQLASQVHRELCFWFSGRLRGGRPEDHRQLLNKFVFKFPKSKNSFNSVIFFFFEQMYY